LTKEGIKRVIGLLNIMNPRGGRISSDKGGTRKRAKRLKKGAANHRQFVSPKTVEGSWGNRKA